MATAREPGRRASASDITADASVDHRAATKPERGNPAPQGRDAIIAMQRQIGNKATGRLLEREASATHAIGGRSLDDADAHAPARAGGGAKLRLQPKRVPIPPATAPRLRASAFPVARPRPHEGDSLQRRIVNNQGSPVIWSAEIVKGLDHLSKESPLRAKIVALHDMGPQLRVGSYAELVNRIGAGELDPLLKTIVGFSPEDKHEGAAAALTDTQLRGMITGVGSSWRRVKATYIPQPEVMKQLIRYRDRVWRSLFANVKVMLKANTDFSSAERAAVDRLSTLFFGSSDLTSDVDLTVVSPSDDELAGAKVEAEAVTLFNQLFVAEWGREPGSVLDVNLYARDFLPVQLAAVKAHVDALTDELKAEEKKEEKIKDEEKKEKAAGTPPSESAAKARADQRAAIGRKRTELRGAITTRQEETKAITRDASGAQTEHQSAESRARVDIINDSMSLLKIRRYLPDQAAWNDFMAETLDGIGSDDGALRSRTTLAFQLADREWKRIHQALDERILAIQQAAGTLDAKVREGTAEVKAREAERLRGTDENVEMAASNRLYEENLRLIVALGAQIAALRREVSGKLTAEQQATLDHLIERYARTKTRSLVLANESYHTGAALKDVLLKQQGKVKVGGWESPGYGVDLTAMDFLQSINEQAGFVTEQLLHTPEGRGFWKAAKYMERICFDIGQIDPPLTQTGEMTRLDETWPELLKIKKDKELTEAVKDTRALAFTTGKFTNQAALHQVVMAVSRQANVQVRSGRRPPLESKTANETKSGPPLAPLVGGTAGTTTTTTATNAVAVTNTAGTPVVTEAKPH